MCILEINQDSQFDILPRINPWDSLDYNNITSPIGVDIV